MSLAKRQILCEFGRMRQYCIIYCSDWIERMLGTKYNIQEYECDYSWIWCWTELGRSHAETLINYLRIILASMRKDANIVRFKKKYSIRIKIKRALWYITWFMLIKPLPRYGCFRWINFVYRLFNAKIGYKSGIHPSAKVFMPWLLDIGDFSVVGSFVTIYNTSMIGIEDECVISEAAYLCTSSHDIYNYKNLQIDKEICLKSKSWIATQAFLGMGVTIGEGAVVGARAAVFKDVEPWTVVGGNPAKVLKKRIINEE